MTENPTCKPNDNSATVSIKEYFTLWITQFENLVNQKFTMTDKALVLSEKALSSRLENMNEWRQTYDDRDDTYFTLAAHVAYQEKTDTAIKQLELTGAELKGKADQRSVSVALAIAGIGVIMSMCSIGLAVVTLFLHLFNAI
jgi:hypothetical protein